MTHIAASYETVMLEYKLSLDKNNTKDQALLDAGFIASKYWSNEILRV
jgi:hypothetical protein